VLTVKVNGCAASSGGPALMFVAQPTTVRGVDPMTSWSGPLVKVGGSLTGCTVTVAVPVACFGSATPFVVPLSAPCR